MFRSILGSVLILGFALFAASCKKGAPVDEQATKNANVGNSNQQAQSAAAPPYMQPTLKGDIERTSLAISMARDAMAQNKTQEAVSLLQGAKKDVDSALARKPRLSDELEALKSAIDRAIPAIERGGKEADTRLTELQTRVGAIKVNTFTQ